MNKKDLGSAILVLLFAAPLAGADDTLDAGWQMDPNGADPDHGNAIDPDGQYLDNDCSPGIDPNGLDAGSSMDPNGC
jgi:hypothetical protein